MAWLSRLILEPRLWLSRASSWKDHMRPQLILFLNIAWPTSSSTMTGVISHYAMQQFAMRGKPPFRIPDAVKDKVRAVQAVSRDNVCQRCRSIFQILLDAQDSSGELETYPHHDNIVELAKSAMNPGAQCPICALFLSTVLENLQDPLPQMYQERQTTISFTEETMDSTVSPVAKAIVRFCYSGPDDALSNRYFQLDLGSDWTTKLPGRIIAREPPVALAKEWVTSCTSSHSTCPRIKDQELPTRLIDVGLPDDELRPRLMQSGRDGELKRGKYLALSHCWGPSRPVVVTETHNLQSHLEHIPFATLSQNFQDAILVTRRLGYRYVWIDSLCIVQNSAEDWEKECTRMETVYANAAITIAAVGAANSSIGFLGPRPQQKACEVQLQHRDGDLVTMRVSRMRTGQACVFNEEKAALDSRAWALQERLLSPRILSLGTDQMYFDCFNAQFFETVRFPVTPRSAERESWLSNPKAMQKRPSTLDFYHTAQWYSTRCLTKGSDRLPAIAGIARRFQSLTGEHYVAGLWRSDILQGLVWRAGWHDSSEHLRTPRYAPVAGSSSPSWLWATCEMAIQFQNIQKDAALVKISRYEVRSKGEDHFGQVCGGELDVIGWVIECAADEKDYKPYWWGEDLRADLCGKKGALVARLFRDRPVPATETPAAPSTSKSAYPSPPADNTAAIDNMEAMGFARADIAEALQAAKDDTDLAVEYLLNGLPKDETEESVPPSLPPRPTSQKVVDSTRVHCLIISRSFPVSYTPGWDWCGLALEPAHEHGVDTFRRVGYVKSSRMYNGYGKLDINPEETMEDIQLGTKRKIRIV